MQYVEWCRHQVSARQSRPIATSRLHPSVSTPAYSSPLSMHPGENIAQRGFARRCTTVLTSHSRFRTMTNSVLNLDLAGPYSLSAKIIISFQDCQNFSTLLQQKMHGNHYLTLSTCTCSSKVALGGISSNPCLP